MPNEEFVNYIMARASYIPWNDDAVHYVLDHHAMLNSIVRIFFYFIKF
jgi:hypothetical protein